MLVLILLRIASSKIKLLYTIECHGPGPACHGRGARRETPRNQRDSDRSNTLLGAMDEDSKLKREEEKEKTSLTPKRRDIAIDMASRCAAEKQTANSKQQGPLGDAPIPASLANRPGESDLRVRVNLRPYSPYSRDR